VGVGVGVLPELWLAVRVPAVELKSEVLEVRAEWITTTGAASKTTTARAVRGDP
jgi:hypothetical protein